MTDPLDKYRRKRKQSATNEPFAAEHTLRALSPGWEGRFVIHQHAATRMHFDLRLEIGGSLQSFAIPKGIHTNPDEKHLAVHTENHPLEYLLFEDVIPQGNYGAGSMIIWDTGRFVLLEADGQESLNRGKIDFVLSGFKAKGRYALIATGRRKAATGFAGTEKKASEWLFIKKKDEHASADDDLVRRRPRSILSGLTVSELARKSEIESEISSQAKTLSVRFPSGTPNNLINPLVPMIVQSGDAPRISKKHLYELKLDGVRIVAHKRERSVALQYRSGRSCTRNYSEIARAVQHLAISDAVLDGEIVAFDADGHPNFGLLAPRIQAKRPADIIRAEAQVQVVYFVFDVLSLGDFDLTAAPLEERKRLLFSLIKGEGYVRALDHIETRGDALWELCTTQQMEGMVVKRLGSPYVLGPELSGDWIKLKRKVDLDCVVVGHTQSLRGELKALLVGCYDEGGELRYLGRVGTGFKNSDRISLAKRFDELSCDSPHLELPDGLGASYLEPALVIKVAHQGLSNSGHLRAASFQGIHEAKRAEECVVPKSMRAGLDEVDKETLFESIDEVNPSTSSPNVDSLLSGTRAQLTNLDKVFFPDDGYTKADIIRYYAAIAPLMLPHLKGRPVVLVRYPDGISGKNFYQWRAPDKTPEWIRTVELYDEEKQKKKGGSKSAFLIDSVDALVHIANLGCIPLHVLASRETSPEHCDFLTIDFDLGPRPLSDGVRLALTLREILDELGMVGFPKTSGQRGLHVLVPLGPGVGFAPAKILCELLGRIVLSRHADIATMQRRIEKRADKIYIDTGQTGRSRTIVAPYSVRAFPGARISAPLSWNEVHLALDPSVFTIETVPYRTAQLGDLMGELLNVKPPIPSVLAQLEKWTSGGDETPG